MVGEWAWPEEAGQTKLPPTNNNILGHVVLRVRNIVHPPVVKPSPPPFPHFTIKACVLGKLCSGKTTCLAGLAEGTQRAIQTQIQAHHSKCGFRLDGVFVAECVCVCRFLLQPMGSTSCQLTR